MHVAATDREGWVTTREALARLGVRWADGLEVLAGLERRGSGRRGDPWRYRLADVMARAAV